MCDRLARIATRWELDEAPRKLCLALDHEYTKKNLAFRNLKGADKARADALIRSKAFDLHLALLERHMSGTPACDYYGSYDRRSYGRSYADNSDNDVDIGDVVVDVVPLRVGDPVASELHSMK